MTVADILGPPPEGANLGTPVRFLNYGPIVNEYSNATMYGPEHNLLNDEDIAVSPNLSNQFPFGSVVRDSFGDIHNVADSSWYHPGQPTYDTVELRNRLAHGPGSITRLGVTDILGPPPTGMNVPDILGPPPNQPPPMLARPEGPEPTSLEALTLNQPEGSPGFEAAMENAYRQQHPEQFGALPPEELVRQMMPGVMTPAPGQIPRSAEPIESPWSEAPVARAITQLEKPLIPPEPREGFRDQPGAVGGVQRRVREELSGLSSPEALGQLFLFKYPVARVAFAAQMAGALPEDIQNVSTAYQSGSAEQLAHAITGAGLHAGMIAAIAGGEAVSAIKSRNAREVPEAPKFPTQEKPPIQEIPPTAAAEIEARGLRASESELGGPVGARNVTDVGRPQEMPSAQAQAEADIRAGRTGQPVRGSLEAQMANELAIRRGQPAPRLREPEPELPRNEEADLPPVPTPHDIDPGLRAVVEDYASKAGIKYSPHQENQPIDEAYSMSIADTYAKLEHNPESPEAVKSYDTFWKAVKGQYDTLVRHGYKIEPWPNEGQPYANSDAMLKDLRENKHLYYFETERGYGEKGDPSMKLKHPMLQGSGIFFNGKEALKNDIFRGVHDALGHGQAGWQFGPRGEYNAFLSHARTMPREAWGALANETVGPNSWTNFGPHMRNAAGRMRQPGEEGYLHLTKRPFTEQRANAYPEAEKLRGLPEREPEGKSRPIPQEEFDALAAEGKEHLEKLSKKPRPAIALTGNGWEQRKDRLYDEVKKDWGGDSFDTHTGGFASEDASLKGKKEGPYAATVRNPGQKTITLPEDATREEFHAAMDRARDYYPQLEHPGVQLGAFHDNGRGTIEIDPALIVQTGREADALGAYTGSKGGAYDFATGNGRFAPHAAKQELSHAATEADLAKRGVTPPTREVQTRDELDAEAKRLASEDPELAASLTRRVLEGENETALTAAEQRVLKHRIERLQVEEDRLRDEVNKPESRTAEEQKTKTQQLEEASQKIVETELALHQTGSTLGASLGSRAGERAIENWSLNKLKADFRARAASGKPIDAKWEKKLENFYDRVVAARDKVSRAAKAAPTSLPKTQKGIRDWINRASKGSEERLTAELKKYARVGITPQAGNPAIIIREASLIAARHIINGTLDAAAAAKRIVDRFGEEIRPFLPQIMERAKELDRIYRGNARYFTEEHLRQTGTGGRATETADIFERLDPEVTIKDAIKGQYLKDWYPKFWNWILDTFPRDTDAIRFSKVFGTYGANSAPLENTIRALKTWIEWEKRGRPNDRTSLERLVEDVVITDKGRAKDRGFKDVMSWGGNIVRALSASDEAIHKVRLSGPKVDPYSMNVGGNLGKATLDRHMATPMAEQLGEKGAAKTTSTYFGISTAGGMRNVLGLKGRAYDAHLRQVAEMLSKIDTRPKAIAGAAIKMSEGGEPHTGRRGDVHPTIINKIQDKLGAKNLQDVVDSYIKNKGSSGFVDNEGTYLTREQAYARADEMGQLTSDLRSKASGPKLEAATFNWFKNKKTEPWDVGNVQAAVWGTVQPLKALSEKIGVPYEDLRSGKHKLTASEEVMLQKLRDEIQPEAIIGHPEVRGLTEQLGRTREDLAGVRAHPEQTIFDRLRDLISPLDDAATAAAQRLTTRGNEFASSPVLSRNALHEAAILAVRDMVHKTIDFAEWSKGMTNKFGDAVKPHLQNIWDEGKSMLAEYSQIAGKRRRDAWMKRTLGRTQELARRIEERDTSPLTPRRVPMEYDPEMLKASAELERVKSDYHDFIDAYKRKTAHPLKKAIYVLGEINALRRGGMTSFDQSYLRRQGGLASTGRPIMTGRAFKDTLQAISKDGYDLTMQKLRTRANSYRHRRSGLAQTDVYAKRTLQEENMIGNWINKIPGIKHSNQLYTAFLNQLRADWWDTMAANFERDGRKLTLAEEKYISNGVNIFTGRGSAKPGGKIEAALNALNEMAFAPRFRYSRYQILTGQPIWKGLSRGNIRGRLRAQMAKEMLRSAIPLFMARQMLRIGIAAGAVKGVTLGSDDPTDSDFGKVVVDGRTRVDFSSGLMPRAVFLARIFNVVQSQLKHKKPKHRIEDMMESEFRSALAPTPGSAYSFLKGKTYDRKRPTLTGELKESMPMTPHDIWDAASKHSLPTTLALAVASWVGESIHTYDKKKTYSRGGK